MALPKKGLRKIIVNDVEYVWMVRKLKGDELNLTIALANNQKRMIQFFDSVKEHYTVIEEKPDGSKWLNSSRQLNSISSKLVREIILAALKNGWEKAEDGVFPINKYIFDVKDSFDTLFEVGLIQQAIETKEYTKVNYLDIEMWSYSPNKLPEEFFHLFYAETKSSFYGIKYFLLKFTQNEEFILNMLIRYSRFLRIPYDKLPEFLASQKYSNIALSEAEIESHLLLFLRSKDAPFKLRHLTIESANFVFQDALTYGLIAKTNKGLIGFIWDNAG